MALFKKGGTQQNTRVSRRTRRMLIILTIEVGLLLVAVLSLLIYYRRSYYSVRVAEAGAVVTASDFLRNGSPNAVFTEDSGSFDTSVPGEYKLKVANGIFTYNTRLVVEDTTPPLGDVLDELEVRSGYDFSADMFFTRIYDHTKVDISFVNEPDHTFKGVQKVELRLTDAGGNTTVYTSELIITDVLYSLTIEVGDPVPDVMSFCGTVREAYFVTDVSVIDTSVPGEHPVEIYAEGVSHTSILRVKDTTPPELTVHKVVDYQYVLKHPEDFVESCTDMTGYTLSFAEEPDINALGRQKVTIVATDSSGNSTSRETELVLKEDTVYPVIYGARYRIFRVGDIIQYKSDVSVADNNPTGLSLEIDSSRVMTSLPGTYRVIYTARDMAGNETVRTVEYTIVARSVTEEYVYKMVDDLLKVLLSDRMDEMERMYSIYDYVAGLITRTSDSQKEDPILACYEGLTKQRGDSYTVACTLKLMLERAGFDTTLINSEKDITGDYLLDGQLDETGNWAWNADGRTWIYVGEGEPTGWVWNAVGHSWEFIEPEEEPAEDETPDEDAEPVVLYDDSDDLVKLDDPNWVWDAEDGIWIWIGPAEGEPDDSEPGEDIPAATDETDSDEADGDEDEPADDGEEIGGTLPDESEDGEVIPDDPDDLDRLDDPDWVWDPEDEIWIWIGSDEDDYEDESEIEHPYIIYDDPEDEDKLDDPDWVWDDEDEFWVWIGPAEDDPARVEDPNWLWNSEDEIWEWAGSDGDDDEYPEDEDIEDEDIDGGDDEDDDDDDGDLEAFDDWVFSEELGTWVWAGPIEEDPTKLDNPDWYWDEEAGAWRWIADDEADDVDEEPEAEEPEDDDTEQSDDGSEDHTDESEAGEKVTDAQDDEPAEPEGPVPDEDGWLEIIPEEEDDFIPNYWCLVKVEGKWFHVDACPRYDKARIFLWNDRIMQKFSAYDRYSHFYESKLYEEICYDEDAYELVYGPDYDRDYRQTLYPGNTIAEEWKEEGYDWH